MFDVSRKFTVHLEGRGDIKVTPADHVASGGEGHVYRPGNASIALKIWDAPHRATSGRMVEKIRLLAALSHPCVVAPQSLARDHAGNIIGYVMPWVTGWDLPLAFTNDWRSAHSFGDAEALALIEKMREVTIFVHSHNVVMGDANELNILGVSGEPRYIDVDPWLPPGYLGDKIMPTIQDWHASSFTKEADWFAWAVVSFQLLTGTHPYRGAHPDFKRSDLEGRMKANASVFDPKARLNAAVRPLTNIPGVLRDWYQSVFQSGNRALPPEVRMVSRPPTAKAAPVIMGTGKLKVTHAFDVQAAFVRNVAPDVILLADETLISLSDGRLFGRGMNPTEFTRRANNLIGAVVQNGSVYFGAVQPGSHMTLSPANITAEKVWSAANRLFAIVRDGILELVPRDLGSRHALLPGRKWSLNPNATVFGDGAAVFDALGAKYLVVPVEGFPVAMVRVRELDNMKPLAILAQGHTVILSLIDRSGGYHRATIVISNALSSYQIKIGQADDGSLSDVILPTGLILWITSEGNLGLPSGETFPLGPAAGGKLIAGPSGVFSVVGSKMFRLSLS